MAEIVLLHHNEPMTTSLAISSGVQLQHKNVLELIYKHIDSLSQFGNVGSDILPAGEVSKFESANSAFHSAADDAEVQIKTRNSRSSRGRPTEVVYLNEQQATLLITFMRNSEIVVRFKVALVKAFFELRDQTAVPPAPTFAPMNHGADILVSADRTFRSMLRSCRAIGLRLPQAISRANDATYRRTGVDLLAEMDATEMVAAQAHRAAAAKAQPLEDPLRPLVIEWAAAHPYIQEIRSEDLIKAILANVSERQLRTAQMRVAAVLRDLGWTHRKSSTGRRENLWVRPLMETVP